MEMSEIKSTGKRKRDTVDGSDLSDEHETKKVKYILNKSKSNRVKCFLILIFYNADNVRSKVKESVRCCLCREEILSGSGSSMKKKIGSTQHSYQEVIIKLFLKERLQSYLEKNDFSSEFLCLECCLLVDELFRLQYELRLKKNRVVNIFKSSRLRAETDREETVVVVENKENRPRDDSKDSASEKAASKDVNETLPQDIVKSCQSNSKKIDNVQPRENVNVSMEVEEIIDKREKGKKIEYLVKWKGYDKPSDNTWEVSSNLGKAVIDNFEKKSKKQDPSSSDNKKRSSMEAAQTKSEKKTKGKQGVEEYIIESLVKKDGNKYLVKWENFPVAQSTWEPRSSIPKFLLEVIMLIHPRCCILKNISVL